MTRMVDVARHAGVSVKTVSRVLNNEPYVQDALREKVRDAVRALNYIPSASARSLRSSRSYRIHIISHSFNSSFMHAIQFGALREGQSAGYQAIVTFLDPDRAGEEAYVTEVLNRICADGKPDGVILLPPLSQDVALNAAVSARDIPIARIGPNNVDDTNATVLIDDRLAAREATEHLIALGHRRIGFVRGKEDQDATHERFAGYRDALDAAGISHDPELVEPGLFDFETGLEAGSRLLDLSTPPTAIFAANDDMAAGVLVAALQRGVAVPDDLSIMGFDDSELASKLYPALSTVRQPLQAFGTKAMEMLTRTAGQGFTSHDDRTETLPYELVVRDTTGPAPKA